MRPPGGPCDHCGRISSPCWRKGPPEKPLLCNACGARYLVKKNLDGYMPGSKPSRRDTGGHSARSNGLAALFVSRPGSEHKRKRKLSKRFADEDDDVIFADYDAGYVSPNDGYIPRPATTRKHTDAQGKLTIDRGTQTITRVRQVTDPSAYRAQKPEFFNMATHEEDQDVSEDEIGSLAVNTLALLRGDAAESSGDSQRSYPLPSPSTRRRRKPARPTVRTLF
ncbi:hypothetical protein WJX77_010999 [Trebouxia sp. C0004]